MGIGNRPCAPKNTGPILSSTALFQVVDVLLHPVGAVTLPLISFHAKANNLQFMFQFLQLLQNAIRLLWGINPFRYLAGVSFFTPGAKLELKKL